MIRCPDIHTSLQVSPVMSTASTLIGGSPDESFEIEYIINLNQKAQSQNREEKQRFIEEYTRKRKTELCKTYSLRGSCKFGNQCSFAHGILELTPKRHLHSNYKTRPCNRFFKDAFCPYGPRCQYLHYELLDLEGEHRDYIEKTCRDFHIPIPLHPSKLDKSKRSDIQRFQNLQKFDLNSEDLIINFAKHEQPHSIKQFCLTAQFQLRFDELAIRKGSEDDILADESFF